jgi:hypothetical protein
MSGYLGLGLGYLTNYFNKKEKKNNDDKKDPTQSQRSSMEEDAEDDDMEEDAEDDDDDEEDPKNSGKMTKEEIEKWNKLVFSFDKDVTLKKFSSNSFEQVTIIITDCFNEKDSGIETILLRVCKMIVELSGCTEEKLVVEVFSKDRLSDEVKRRIKDNHIVVDISLQTPPNLLFFGPKINEVNLFASLRKYNLALPTPDEAFIRILDGPFMRYSPIRTISDITRFDPLLMKVKIYNFKILIAEDKLKVTYKTGNVEFKNKQLELYQVLNYDQSTKRLYLFSLDIYGRSRDSDWESYRMCYITIPDTYKDHKLVEFPTDYTFEIFGTQDNQPLKSLWQNKGKPHPYVMSIESAKCTDEKIHSIVGAIQETSVGIKNPYKLYLYSPNAFSPNAFSLTALAMVEFRRCKDPNEDFINWEKMTAVKQAPKVLSKIPTTPNDYISVITANIAGKTVNDLKDHRPVLAFLLFGEPLIQSTDQISITQKDICEKIIPCCFGILLQEVGPSMFVCEVPPVLTSQKKINHDESKHKINVINLASRVMKFDFEKANPQIVYPPDIGEDYIKNFSDSSTHVDEYLQTKFKEKGTYHNFIKIVDPIGLKETSWVLTPEIKEDFFGIKSGIDAIKFASLDSITRQQYKLNCFNLKHGRFICGVYENAEKSQSSDYKKSYAYIGFHKINHNGAQYTFDFEQSRACVPIVYDVRTVLVIKPVYTISLVAAPAGGVAGAQKKNIDNLLLVSLHSPCRGHGTTAIDPAVKFTQHLMLITVPAILTDPQLLDMKSSLNNKCVLEGDFNLYASNPNELIQSVEHILKDPYIMEKVFSGIHDGRDLYTRCQNFYHQTLRDSNNDLYNIKVSITSPEATRVVSADATDFDFQIEISWGKRLQGGAAPVSNTTFIFMDSNLFTDHSAVALLFSFPLNDPLIRQPVKKVRLRSAADQIIKYTREIKSNWEFLATGITLGKHKKNASNASQDSSNTSPPKKKEKVVGTQVSPATASGSHFGQGYGLRRIGGPAGGSINKIQQIKEQIKIIKDKYKNTKLNKYLIQIDNLKYKIILQTFTDKLFKIKEKIKDYKTEIKANPNKKDKYIKHINKLVEKFNVLKQEQDTLKQNIKLKSTKNPKHTKESIKDPKPTKDPKHTKETKPTKDPKHTKESIKETKPTKDLKHTKDPKLTKDLKLTKDPKLTTPSKLTTQPKPTKNPTKDPKLTTPSKPTKDSIKNPKSTKDSIKNPKSTKTTLNTHQIH